MSSVAARRWADQVLAKAQGLGKPLTLYFTRVPQGCRRSGCQGYHDTWAVTVHPDGRIYREPVYGFHALVVNAEPRPVGQGADDLARVAFGLLCWARRVSPWACYPDVAWPEGQDEPVWLS